ncbi:MAG: DUF975 family protein [Oscillospiraceae bacterium]|nr:DUF975 family protein [Oscillospiraceae bacterium]
MGFDRAAIKANARLHVKNNYGPNILVFVIYVAICTVCAAIPVVGWVAELLVTPLMLVGYIGWFQKSIYQQGLSSGEIFAPFKENMWGTMGTMLLMSLKVMLWSLLLYIPGIVKSYEYFAVPFLKSENPNIPCDRCFQMSKAMTDGHKMDIFIMQISFLGWIILSCFTFGILTIFYVQPYMMAANAFAYEQIKAEAIANGRINPMEIDPAYGGGSFMGSDKVGF